MSFFIKNKSIIMEKLILCLNMKHSLLFALIILVGLLSCKSQTDSNQKLEDQDTTNISNSKERADEIFQDVIREKPLLCEQVAFNNGTYIIGVIKQSTSTFEKYDFIVLHKLENKWQKKLSEIYGEEYKYITPLDTFQLVYIEKKPYIYFQLLENFAGTASAGFSTISFNLFDIISGQFLSLLYEGKDKDENTVEGEFTNKGEFNNALLILNFLEDKASKSKSIYKPSKKELVSDNSKNYEKKWKVDNSNIPDIYSAKGVKEGILKLTYYKKELMPFAEALNKIESSEFIIVSYFRNNVIGYDKKQKKYFPIWIEGCNHCCNKEISFVDDWTVKVYWDECGDNITMTINLRDKKYKIRFD